MYSGSTLTVYSGRILGAHQKIDRVARKHLTSLLPVSSSMSCFPIIRDILHFEGGNGPDAIKRKSPAQDEPWHYINPYDKTDTKLYELIQEHYDNLVRALKQDNQTRAAFEAAWLAHAIVDGLTPAHHYPYEEKLEELRGEGKETRISIKQKLILPGETRAKQVSNNWKMWGPKGLFTTHGAFEWGVATLILPLSLRQAKPTDMQIDDILERGVVGWFQKTVREIADLEMYEAFYKTGWTRRLASKVRKQLAPSIVRSVTLIWYVAALDAGLVEAAPSAGVSA